MNIQRMTLFALLVVLLVLSCSKSKTTVSGQIFSQTEGKPSKHALIKILVFRETDFDMKMADNKTKIQSDLRAFEEAFQTCLKDPANVNTPMFERYGTSLEYARDGKGGCYRKQDGAMLASLSFLFQLNPMMSATSNADGVFTFTAPGNEKYVLIAEVAGQVWMKKVRLTGPKMEVLYNDSDKIIPTTLEATFNLLK